MSMQLTSRDVRHDERVSVIIVTYRRASSLRECLSHLSRQTEPADQIIVVDGSEDSLSANVVMEFTEATYVRHPPGAGNRPSSRNTGVSSAIGEIIAFLDDDAYPQPDYLQSLRRAYRDRA